MNDTERRIQEIESELKKDGHAVLIDGPQAAAILRCSVSSLRRWRADGLIETVYPSGSGRPLLFYRSELARYLAEI